VGELENRLHSVFMVRHTVGHIQGVRKRLKGPAAAAEAAAAW